MHAHEITTSNSFTARPRIVGGLIVLAIVFAVFAQCIFFDFVGWDDALFITSNPRFNPATIGTVWFYWTHAGFNLYMPMTYSLWTGVAKLAELPVADAAGNRLNPFIFHLVGLLCHLITTAAVYGILLMAVRSIAAAMMGAIAFAIHPLMTESVAFIGTMNTPLAAALALPAVWLYLSHDPIHGRWRWALATVLYGLSLLAKPTTVTIPLLALCLEIVALHRPLRRAIAGTVPWVLMTVPCLIWTRIIQSANGVRTVPLWSRPRVAGDAAGFYLEKIIWPTRLTVDYGRTPAWILSHHATAIICLVPIALLVNAWILRNRQPLLAAAMVLYLMLLLPNSGLVSFEYQRVSNVADRYAYLAMIAIALAIAAGLSHLRAGLPRRVGYGAMILLLIWWAALTTLQLRTWRNGVVLFTHAVEITPQSFYSYQCLAQADLIAEDANAALLAATRSIELNPLNHPLRTGVPAPDAASAWAEAAQAHIARGNALDRLNRFSEAAAEFTIALQLNPGNAIAAKDLVIVRDRKNVR